MNAVRGVLPALVVAWSAAAHAAFERPALTPEAEASGGVLALADDPVFGNPAAAAAPRRATAAIASVARPFGLPELSETAAGVAWRGATGVALGARRFGSIAYAEKELRAGAARSAGRSVVFGLVARGMSAGGEGIPVHRTVSVDAGVIARPDPETRAAAFVGTLLGEIPGDPAGRGRRTAFGVARRVVPGMEVLVELARREDGPIGAVAGLAWAPHPDLTIRCGAGDHPGRVSWGLTARRGVLACSFSAVGSGVPGRTVRLAVAIRP